MIYILQIKKSSEPARYYEEERNSHCSSPLCCSLSEQVRHLCCPHSAVISIFSSTTYSFHLLILPFIISFLLPCIFLSMRPYLYKFNYFRLFLLVPVLYFFLLFHLHSLPSESPYFRLSIFSFLLRYWGKNLKADHYLF